MEPKIPVRIVILDDNEPGPAKVINIPKEEWDAGNVINVSKKEPGKIHNAAGAVTSTVATGGKAAATGVRKLFGGFASIVVGSVKTAKEGIHDAAAEYDARQAEKEQKKAIHKVVENEVEKVFAGKAPNETVVCEAKPNK